MPNDDTDPVLAAFGAWLRRLREATKDKLSQQDVGARMGVHHMTIWRWENGKTSPDVSDLLKLAPIYGVLFEEIVLGGIDVAIPEAVLSFLKTSEGKSLSVLQQRALALLVQNVEHVDDAKLRAIVYALQSGPPSGKR